MTPEGRVTATRKTVERITRRVDCAEFRRMMGQRPKNNSQHLKTDAPIRGKWAATHVAQLSHVPFACGQESCTYVSSWGHVLNRFAFRDIGHLGCDTVQFGK